VFDVKAFRLFTQHQTPPDALPKDVREGLAPREKKNLYYKDMPAAVLDELWERFRSALDPLRHSDKLAWCCSSSRLGSCTAPQAWT
jgi:hypothetical protein